MFKNLDDIKLFIDSYNPGLVIHNLSYVIRHLDYEFLPARISGEVLEISFQTMYGNFKVMVTRDLHIWSNHSLAEEAFTNLLKHLHTNDDVNKQSFDYEFVPFSWTDCFQANVKNIGNLDNIAIVKDDLEEELQIFILKKKDEKKRCLYEKFDHLFSDICKALNKSMNSKYAISKSDDVDHRTYNIQIDHKNIWVCGTIFKDGHNTISIHRFGNLQKTLATFHNVTHKSIANIISISKVINNL